VEATKKSGYALIKTAHYTPTEWAKDQIGEVEYT
jgi:hypothetical protein